MNDPKFEQIFSLIRASREASGISQASLGRSIDLPQSHISKIERGDVDLRLSSLINIVNALDQEIVIVPRQRAAAVKALVATEQRQVSKQVHKAKKIFQRLEEQGHRIQTVMPRLYKESMRDSLLTLRGSLPKLSDIDGMETYAKRFERVNEETTIQTARNLMSHFRNWVLDQHSSRQEGNVSDSEPAYRLDNDLDNDLD